MKQASFKPLAFFLLLFCLVCVSSELWANAPNPPSSQNAPLPAAWLLLAGGVVVGIAGRIGRNSSNSQQQ